MLLCWHGSKRGSMWLYNATSTLGQGRCLPRRRSLSLNRVSGHDIYLSNSTNPYFNLAVEHWLFRHADPSAPLLLIYRNSPCVVIGRHQNPWIEINMKALNAAGLPFIRRWSGGGTVYHDLGNTNFSIHLNRSSFNRRFTGEIILRAVRSLGVDASLNERNDILACSNKMSSAYKIAHNRAMHHGTMLIAGELNTLKEVLHPPKVSVISKSVSSIRSPVTNLNHFDRSITHESFAEAVIDEFRKEFGVSSDVCIVDQSLSDDSEDIRSAMSELQTWNSMYGPTPEFQRSLHRLFEWGEVETEIRSKRGVIVDFQVSIKSDHFSSEIAGMMKEYFNTLFHEQPYGFRNDTINNFQEDLVAYNGYVTDVRRWLEKEVGN